MLLIYHLLFTLEMFANVLTYLSVETSLLCPWPLTALCTVALFTSAGRENTKSEISPPASKASDGVSCTICGSQHLYFRVSDIDHKLAGRS